LIAPELQKTDLPTQGLEFSLLESEHNDAAASARALKTTRLCPMCVIFCP
jgi:hypothetical protein